MHKILFVKRHMVAMSGNHITLHNIRLHRAKTALVTYCINIRSIFSIIQPVIKLCRLAFTAVPPCLQRDLVLRLPPPSHQHLYCHVLLNEIIVMKNAEVAHLDSWNVIVYINNLLFLT
jgi:hypothetical protein